MVASKTAPLLLSRNVKIRKFSKKGSSVVLRFSAIATGLKVLSVHEKVLSTL